MSLFFLPTTQQKQSRRISIRRLFIMLLLLLLIGIRFIISIKKQWNIETTIRNNIKTNYNYNNYNNINNIMTTSDDVYENSFNASNHSMTSNISGAVSWTSSPAVVISTNTNPVVARKGRDEGYDEEKGGGGYNNNGSNKNTTTTITIRDEFHIKNDTVETSAASAASSSSSSTITTTTTNSLSKLSQDLLKMVDNSSSSLLDQQQQQQQQISFLLSKQDYCHSISSTTTNTTTTTTTIQIVNNSYHNDILDWKGCPTSYNISTIITKKKLPPFILSPQQQKQQQQQQQGDDGSDGSELRRRRRRRHTTRAICEFTHTKIYWHQMPHAMQQLYTCFSFWMSHVEEYNKNNTNTTYSSSSSSHFSSPVSSGDSASASSSASSVTTSSTTSSSYEEDDLKLILIWDPSRVPGIDLRFIYGMHEIFQTVFQVEIYNTTNHMQMEYYYHTNNNTNNNNRTTTITTIEDSYVTIPFSAKIQKGQISGFRMENSNHAQLLREMTATYYPHIFTTTTTTTSSSSTTNTTATPTSTASITTSTNKTIESSKVTTTTDASGSSSSGCHHRRHPIIGILNRAPTPRWRGRTIENVNLLQKILQQEFEKDNDYDDDDHDGIIIHPIQYFENSTVWEQLSWYYNVDIVISPHGAQLTGIPFIRKCGGLLEFFPKEYYIPYYFGSLASISGLEYFHMYLGSNVTNEWYEGTKKNVNRQQYVRTRTNMCIPINETIQAVHILINHWYSCCNK